MSRGILKLVFLPLMICVTVRFPEQVALVHPITPEASEGWKAMCQVQHGGEVGKIVSVFRIGNFKTIKVGSYCKNWKDAHL